MAKTQVTVGQQEPEEVATSAESPTQEAPMTFKVENLEITVKELNGLEILNIDKLIPGVTNQMTAFAYRALGAIRNVNGRPFEMMKTEFDLETRANLFKNGRDYDSFVTWFVTNHLLTPEQVEQLKNS